MQIEFTPEQEAHFHEGVERGVAAADRGEFVEAAQVWAKVEAMLQS